MTNGNGNGWTKWVIRFLVGTLATAIIVVLQVHDSKISAVEKDARVERKEMQNCLTKAVMEQKDINKDMLIALKEIQKDILYIRKDMDNGRHN